LSGPSWHCRHYISLTAVLEFGPTETLPPVKAISKHPGVSADAVAKPSAQTRADSRVLDLRKRLRLEKLTQSGEFDQVARHHAEYYRDLFERADIVR
jgi:hypothetical protein